jgi:hypothetical protein
MANEMKLQESMALAHSIRRAWSASAQQERSSVRTPAFGQRRLSSCSGLRRQALLAENRELSSVEAEEASAAGEYRDENAFLSG